MKLSRRGLIRLILFASAAIIVLLIRNMLMMKENRRKEILIRNNYVRAIEDMSASVDNIKNTLEKQLYSASGEQQAILASKLFNEAANAKTAMSQLPIQELSLENTYKFLSQVGNYAQSLAKKSSAGEEITRDEYENLKALLNYSEQLCEQMWKLENAVASGEIDVAEVSNNTMLDQPEITEGFTDLEEGFSSYPRLIYDGPFSDHIMEKESQMLKNAEEITQKRALERAASILGVSSNALTEVNEQNGNMPCWVFSDKDNTMACAVTKQGGYVSYFIKSRIPQKAAYSVDECVKKAEEFLGKTIYSNMKVTYYEQSQNTVTVNLAYTIDDVVCYTDLIKVTVAMDDGDILGFEATGYLVNHIKRAFPDKTISILGCEKKLSPYLICQSHGKALIPTDGGDEVYCYEYKCKGEDGRNILVYLNAQTGEEEQILILIESKNGTLTM